MFRRAVKYIMQLKARPPHHFDAEFAVIMLWGLL